MKRKRRQLNRPSPVRLAAASPSTLADRMLAVAAFRRQVELCRTCALKGCDRCPVVVLLYPRFTAN